jgi:hypothetical protein
MSAFTVLHRHGTPALLLFTILLAAFSVLHLVRLPLLALAWLLERAMRAVDDGLSHTTARPRVQPQARRWGDQWGEAIPRT